MAIPERIWKNWLVTQLVGKTAPEIIQLGQGSTTEIIARYFEPLTSEVEKPNPYNRGTDLEGVAWRDTFIDGITLAPSDSDDLLDVFGVPSAIFTIRVYYNRELFREITGGETLPTTYDEFVALCQKVEAFRTADGGRILPIAGSKYNAPYMLDALFQSQTQQLKLVLGETANLGANTEEVAMA